MSRDLIIVLVVQEVEDNVENEGHYDLQRLVSVNMLKQFQVVSRKEGLPDLEEFKFQRIFLLYTQQFWIRDLKSDSCEEITGVFNYMGGDKFLDIIPVNQILHVYQLSLLRLFECRKELAH